MDRRRRRRAARQPAAAWRHPVSWLRGRRSGGLLPGGTKLFAEHARLPGARGGTPGSGAPGVHLHRVLAGRLDSAAPRDVLLAQLAELYPLLLPDAARHPGPHAPGRRAPGQRSDTRGDQAALPPPWGVLRAQLRAGDRPDLAGRLPDRQSRRGRGLLPADRYPMDLARRPAPEYPPGTPGDGAPPAQRRDAVVQPRAHVPCLQHAAGPGPGLARRGRRTGPAAQRLLRRRQPDRGGGAGHHPRRLPRGNPRVRLGARRCPDARQLHQRPRPRAVHRRAQGAGGDDRPACPPTQNPCEG